jgi:hypothetical protein
MPPGAVSPEERVDRLQQFFAVPQRYAKQRQVIICEVGQNIAVDRLLGKQRPILAKPDSFKPRIHI